MMETKGTTIRKKGAAKRRNSRMGRSAEAMKPRFSPLRDENHKSFGLFLRGVRCKLLNRLALEPGIAGIARFDAAGDVTLVILFNLHPKSNLRCEVSTSLLQKTCAGETSAYERNHHETVFERIGLDASAHRPRPAQPSWDTSSSLSAGISRRARNGAAKGDARDQGRRRQGARGGTDHSERIRVGAIRPRYRSAHPRSSSTCACGASPSRASRSHTPV